MQYKNDESMKKAMEWNNTWYKGSNITVEKLGEETKGTEPRPCQLSSAPGEICAS